jgi:putative DNA primase/helicase
VASTIKANAALDGATREVLAGAWNLRHRELAGVKLPIADVRALLGAARTITSDFIDTNEQGHPLPTIENLKVLLQRIGITVRYNVIRKKNEITIPDHGFTRDNLENASIAHVMSECSRVRMPTMLVPQFLYSIADENQYNPVLTWVESAPWDGSSRLHAFYDTVISSNTLKNQLLRKWLIQAIAAASSPNGIAAQGVLTLVGPQNIGKTTWFRNLAPEALELVMLGRSLDLKNKDSILSCISYWIVELGELDATFNKSDISALKAFTTQSSDTYRRPYAPTDSNYPRRTVFGGSVNEVNYLRDQTGNRRFWTIEATALNFNHNINMQQLWAEVLTLHQAAEPFYLSPEEVAELEEHNENYTLRHPIDQKIAEEFPWPLGTNEESWTWQTAGKVLTSIGISDHKTADQQAAGRALRRLNGGKFRRSHGRNQYAVPLRQEGEILG